MYTLLKKKKPKKYPIYRQGVAATIFQGLSLTFCQYNIVDISKNGKKTPKYCCCLLGRLLINAFVQASCK